MRKLWILALLPLLFIFGCNKNEIDIWQWVYYPDWILLDEIYWPIFDNYDACSSWALYKYSEWYDAMCTKICNSFSSDWWVPVCEDVIRTWHPDIWIWKIFEWMEDFKANSFADLIVDLRNGVNEWGSLSFVKFRELYPEYVYDWSDVVNLFDVIKQNPDYTDDQLKTVAETLYPSLLWK